MIFWARGLSGTEVDRKDKRSWDEADAAAGGRFRTWGRHAGSKLHHLRHLLQVSFFEFGQFDGHVTRRLIARIGGLTHGIISPKQLIAKRPALLHGGKWHEENGYE